MRLFPARSMFWLFVSAVLWLVLIFIALSGGYATNIALAAFAAITCWIMWLLHKSVGKSIWLFIVIYGPPILVTGYLIYVSLGEFIIPEDIPLVTVLVGSFILSMILLVPWAIFVTFPIMVKSLFIILLGEYLRVVFVYGSTGFYLQNSRTHLYLRKSSALYAPDHPVYADRFSDAWSFTTSDEAVLYAISLKCRVLPFQD